MISQGISHGLIIIAIIAFQKVLDESGPKLNKIWVNRVSELYKRSMKSWLQDNDTEIYLTHNVFLKKSLEH